MKLSVIYRMIIMCNQLTSKNELNSKCLNWSGVCVSYALVDPSIFSEYIVNNQ